MQKVNFAGYVCVVNVTTYVKPKNNAIQLLDANDGSSVTVASVNPDFMLPDGEVAIKSWSENEGMANCLMAAGIIGPVKYTIPSGWVEMTVHDLLIK